MTEATVAAACLLAAAAVLCVPVGGWLAKRELRRRQRGNPLFIATDFDGTIVAHEFPEIGAPAPGAFEWLKRWRDAGGHIILWTMRSDGRTGTGKENGPVLTEAVEFCRKNGVEFFGVNENPTQAAWTNSPKCYAHAYVDDAGLGCPLRENPKAGGRPVVDWSVVGPLVLEMIHAHNRGRAAK